MERKLIIMRHAKSSWEDGIPTDHARPLNPRGRQDAPRVAQRLVEIDWAPHIILSSDAQRTRETALGMLPEFPSPPELRWYPSFYHGDLRAIVSAVACVPDQLQIVLVLGHNPGWETAASRLSGQRLGLTTANAVLLTHDSPHWATAITDFGAWQLQQIVRPKELP